MADNGIAPEKWYGWIARDYAFGLTTIENAEGNRVASVHDPRHARVMAAAPELYRTILRVQAWFAADESGDCADCTKIKSEIDQAVDGLRKMIAESVTL